MNSTPLRRYHAAMNDQRAQAAAGNTAGGNDEFTIRPLFSVPIIQARLPDCEQLNRELTDVFLETEKGGDEYRNRDTFVHRNEALYESRFDLFDWPRDCIQQLRNFCMERLYSTIGQLNGYDLETLKRLHVALESWFHITRRGGYFSAHHHPMHSWSGVYCVKHDGDEPESQSGRLCFINPNANGAMYLDTAISNMRPPFDYAPRRMRLVPGQLVLFPSWLLHEVMPYEGDTLRITVAFNARFRMTGAPPG